MKVADFGLSRVTTLLRTGLGQTSFAGSRSLQQSFNDVRCTAYWVRPTCLCRGPACVVWGTWRASRETLCDIPYWLCCAGREASSES